MNEINLRLLEVWLAGRLGPIADLGALNINGGWRHLTGETVIGFDLESGPGVDVVLKSGVVPARYRGQFGAVVAASAIQFAPDPHDFMREAARLAAPGAALWLSWCPTWCRASHTTSAATKAVPVQRWTVENMTEQLRAWFTLDVATIRQDVFVWEGYRNDQD